MKIETRRERAVGWLEKVRNDVKHLLLDQQIFNELQDIIAANSELQRKDGTFQVWFTQSYIRSMTVLVRRQVKVDKEKKSISLMAVLDEVQKNPELVTREHYLSCYGPEEWQRQPGIQYLDGIAGVGAEHLPTSVIESHIKELREASERIEHYVDRYIAHLDSRGMTKPMPTFAELNTSLAVLEKLTCVYVNLLTGTGYDDLRRPLPERWKDSLRLAWVIDPNWPDIELDTD